MRRFASQFCTALKLSAALAIVLLSGCGDAPTPPNSRVPDIPSPSDPPPSNKLELVFTYSSEKKEWINAVTPAFNAANHTTKSGKTIVVTAIPMGSGECIDEILAGRRKPHLTSPASAAFIKLGNAQARASSGKDVIEKSENLVLSPVVIAMWKPMAEAIGWGKKPVGWSEILDLARDPQGWSAHGHPEWGEFKFGHTHPDYSNSGLASIFAEVYAAAGKKSGLTVGDLDKPELAAYMRQIEHSVVHYGSSTGFFGDKMIDNGPQYLSAAVLYENMVVQAYGGKQTAFPLVAIYPKEGTFWSDHPAGIVEREWVTPEHREAARQYLDYLLAQPQQVQAMTLGFRPGIPEVALAAPLDAAHGIDPKEPTNTLDVPSADVMDGITKLWRANKKRSNVVLVLDISGSMNDNNKIVAAKKGALELVRMLGDEDRFSFMPFNNRIAWANDLKGVSLKTARENANNAIGSVFASGGTALYDAINTAYETMLKDPQPDMASAMVVLTDGEDTDSTTRFEQLLSKVKIDNEKHNIRIFTIGYGADARQDVLKAISEKTQAKSYKSDTDDILKVFKDISTFF